MGTKKLNKRSDTDVPNPNLAKKKKKTKKHKKVKPTSKVIQHKPHHRWTRKNQHQDDEEYANDEASGVNPGSDYDYKSKYFRCYFMN